MLLTNLPGMAFLLRILTIALVGSNHLPMVDVNVAVDVESGHLPMVGVDVAVEVDSENLPRVEVDVEVEVDAAGAICSNEGGLYLVNYFYILV